MAHTHYSCDIDKTWSNRTRPIGVASIMKICVDTCKCCVLETFVSPDITLRPECNEYYCLFYTISFCGFDSFTECSTTGRECKHSPDN